MPALAIVLAGVSFVDAKEGKTEDKKSDVKEVGVLNKKDGYYSATESGKQGQSAAGAAEGKATQIATTVGSRQNSLIGEGGKPVVKPTSAVLGDKQASVSAAESGKGQATQISAVTSGNSQGYSAAELGTKGQSGAQEAEEGEAKGKVKEVSVKKPAIGIDPKLS